MKYIVIFIYLFICNFLFFIITSKICGKACNYDCSKCHNWACTHGGMYEGHGCYPVIDWSRWCLKK